MRGWRPFWALLSTLTLLCAVASAGPAQAAPKSHGVTPWAPLAQAAPQSPTGATPWTPPAPAWRVSVEADGLYQLDYGYLATAGLPVDTINPSTFRMFYMNQEIPLRVEGDGDNQFESGEVVLFYGRGVDSLFLDGLTPTRKYTASSVFWLTYGGSAGLRMADRGGPGASTPSAAYPRREHIERQYYYLSAYPFQSNADHWFADPLYAPLNGSGSLTYDFTAQDLPAGSFTARLQTRTLGYQLRPHHLRIYVNGTLVAEDATSWADYAVFQTSTNFDQSLLVEGNNSIKLELVDLPGAPDAGDSAYVDWVDVTYQDSYTAEGDQLPFVVDAAGDKEFTVAGFSSDAYRGL